MPNPGKQLSDEELRKLRLVFYKEDIQQIDSALRDFLQRSKVYGFMGISSEVSLGSHSFIHSRFAPGDSVFLTILKPWHMTSPHSSIRPRPH